MALDPIDCNSQDEATQKCSCPQNFSMSKFNSTCVASDAAYSLQPINVSFHSQPTAVSVGSQDECRALCAQNDSCNAALFDLNDSSCALFPILYTMARPAQGTSGGQVMFLKIAAFKKKSKPMVVIVTIPSAVAVVFLGFILWKWCSNKIHIQRNHDQFLQELSKLPPRFSYKDLQVATNGFSTKIAAGAFGSVFEGVLSTPNGTIKVAVKRLEKIYGTEDSQFKAEIATIGSVSHVNLVLLKGFCIEKDVRLLVFELIGRGSLDKWLYRQWDDPISDVDQREISDKPLLKLRQSFKSHEPPGMVLDWEQRCQIALDMAKGLEYLHHHSTEHIVHCDVKPANILLDENFHAKIADFGLAKLMGRGTKSFAVTTVKGTRGYLAPEWLREGTITAKVDVYSYGVVLLELLTGRRCFDSEHGYVPLWAMKMLAATQDRAASTSSPRVSKDSSLLISPENASVLQSVITDERLHGSNVSASHFLHMLKVALACVQADPVNRPSMASVVQVLEGMTDSPYSLCNLKLLSSMENQFPAAAKFSLRSSDTGFGGVVSMSSQMFLEGR